MINHTLLQFVSLIYGRQSNSHRFQGPGGLPMWRSAEAQKFGSARLIDESEVFEYFDRRFQLFKVVQQFV